VLEIIKGEKMTTKEFYSNFVEKTNITEYFIVFAITYSASFVFFYMNQILLFCLWSFCSWLILFAIFDSVGYGLGVWTNKLWFLEAIIVEGRIIKTTLEIFLYPYRILQNFFMWYTMSQFVFINYHISIACLISWWFGVADLLYYSILKVAIDKDLPWMDNWSVFWLLNKLGIKSTRTNFYFFAILGFLVSCAYLVWFVK